MEQCTWTLGPHARRFVARVGAGALHTTRPPTPRIVCRLRRVLHSVAAVVAYAGRRRLDLDAALTAPALARAYTICQPPVAYDVYRRTVYLWRWARQHPEWDPATDPYVVVDTRGSYRWCNALVADLFGYGSPDEILQLGDIRTDSDPLRRTLYGMGLKLAGRQATRWGMRLPSGRELVLRSQPIRDDRGDCVLILARFEDTAVPVLPRLPLPPQPGMALVLSPAPAPTPSPAPAPRPLSGVH